MNTLTADSIMCGSRRSSSSRKSTRSPGSSRVLRFARAKGRCCQELVERHEDGRRRHPDRLDPPGASRHRRRRSWTGCVEPAPMPRLRRKPPVVGRDDDAHSGAHGWASGNNQRRTPARTAPSRDRIGRRLRQARAPRPSLLARDPVAAETSGRRRSPSYDAAEVRLGQHARVDQAEIATPPVPPEMTHRWRLTTPSKPVSRPSSGMRMPSGVWLCL